MAYKTFIVPLWSVWAAGLGDRRDGVLGDSQAAAGVVPGDVVGHQTEERRQREKAAAGDRAGELSDRLDVAPQAPTGDGAALVEVDETYVGGREEAQGRGARSKALVVIAVEKKGRRLGRARMAVVNDATRAELCRFVRTCVDQESTVRTDGGSGYLGLKNMNDKHDRVLQKHGLASPSELFPGVHRLASLLKRWLLGTHQGAVSAAHLPYYLDEFTFRFNRRASKSRGLLFRRLVEQAVAIEPTPLKNLIRLNHNI